MRFLLRLIFFLALSGYGLFAQNYLGPAEGSVPSGGVVTTDNFLRIAPVTEPKERGIRNIYKSLQDQNYIPDRFTDTREGDNYFEDPSVKEKNTLYDTAMAVLLKSFFGMGETNSIPPDPYIAVGPTHIITTVNSNFSIWDKEGNLVKQINAGSWFSVPVSGLDPFDPKVLYDHFDKRWIMVWLDQDDTQQRGYHLISVSDDSIPTGTWYNWALPSDQNGMTEVDNWGDYQGVGFDKNAIYISSNQFKFGASFQYVKLRIIPKAQLYSNTAGPAVWKDIWNIGYPAGGPLSNVFNVRPAIMYSESNDFYLLHTPNFGNGSDFMALYKISNALTNPVLSGSIVPVNFSLPAPNANQLGGSTILLETGGSHLRNEPKFRDGFLYAVHSVRNPPVGASVRYVKINISNSTAVEDISMGAQNYWYSYPAIEVDKDHNIGLTYSRSATTEYIGAYYTYRINTDPPGLRGSLTLQTGKGNYVKDYNSGRNRWGDYNGLWLDPSDNYSMWMFAEYSAGLSIWGTWIGKIRLTPFTGIYTSLSASTLKFGNVEINTDSDTLELHVSNYGESDLVITNIPASQGEFRILNNLSFPYTIATYDTLTLKFLFSPVDTGAYNITYTVASNDPAFDGFPLNAYAYKILPASDNSLYAVSGNSGNNISFTLNPSTGASSILGTTKIRELKSIAVNPKNHLIYGVSSDNHIVRVNGEKGDAYNLIATELVDLIAAAFDTSGQLYCAQRSGEIFRVDLENKSLTQISLAKINISDMAFNPFSNQLWASIFLPVGANKDRIYKIDLLTGDTLLVGKTGFNNFSPALTFDGNGNLYGMSGTSTQINNLIKIDTSSGQGSLIGATGIKDISGLAFNYNAAVSVEDDYAAFPSEFNLKQNYPNPFNPATVLEFSIPEASNVKLTVYNLVGEIIDVLLNSDIKAGTHKVTWNPGKKLSSGIYFYEINAITRSGGNFTQMKKMILMK